MTMLTDMTARNPLKSVRECGFNCVEPGIKLWLKPYNKVIGVIHINSDAMKNFIMTLAIGIFNLSTMSHKSFTIGLA